MSATNNSFKASYWQRLKVAFQYVMPQIYMTRIAGYLAEKEWGSFTHLVIKLFAKKYDINMQEAAKSSYNDYPTFNAFFTRELKDGVRPIVEEDKTLCLPADGRISECGKIENDLLIQAKGHYFSLEDLLGGNKNLAKTFENGNFATIYLSPRDYHRVHMPCDATLRQMTYVPGELFSVNPFLAEHVPNLFARNERVICLFDTEFGPMVQILVGATITASMKTVWSGVVNPPRYKRVVDWYYDSDEVISLKKGQEMGAFQLGSTVINLFVKDSVTLAPELMVGHPVKMGERLGTITK